MMAGAETAFLDHGVTLRREVTKLGGTRSLRALWSTALLMAGDFFLQTYNGDINYLILSFGVTLTQHFSRYIIQHFSTVP